MQRRHFHYWVGLTAGGLIFAPGLSGCGGSSSADLTAPVYSGGAVPSGVTVGSSSYGELSAEEVEGLYYIREEEKLAHDIYAALYVRWSAPIFADIAQSEAWRTEAVRLQILVHGLEDPAAGNPAGVFENVEMQALYIQLLALGQDSLLDALKVGCLIEEMDIRDITSRQKQVVDEPDIVQLYDNLLCGSRNHLRAFNSQLVAQGGSYTAQVISQAEWNAIANSAREVCAG